MFFDAGSGTWRPRLIDRPRQVNGYRRLRRAKAIKALQRNLIAQAGRIVPGGFWELGALQWVVSLRAFRLQMRSAAGLLLSFLDLGFPRELIVGADAGIAEFFNSFISPKRGA